MPELQWILVGLALIALAAIYLFWNRRPRYRADVRQTRRREPVFHTGAAERPDDTAPAKEPAKERAKIDDRDRKIVALRVSAKPGQVFSGEAVAARFEALAIRYGQYGIFHRYATNDQGDHGGDAVFSIADRVEPGSFPSADLSGRSISGLSIFLQLPGPVDGVRAFNEMIDAAQALADALDADIHDASGSTVTGQTVAHMRDDVVNWMQRRAAAAIPGGR